MKSKLPTLKEYRILLKTLSKNKLIDICVKDLKRAKERERFHNEAVAKEIAENVNLPADIGGVTAKQARKEIKDLGFSLKEIEEMFPKDEHRGLWE